MGEGRPRPFHERFDIEVGIEEAQWRFLNRVSNIIFDNLYDEIASNESEYTTDKWVTVKKKVASRLGERYKPRERFEVCLEGDFRRCLQALEAVYQALEDNPAQAWLSDQIDEVVRNSETDSGISWQPPVFVRTGAPLLDEHLVNEPLRWLSETRYESVRKPFEKAQPIGNPAKAAHDEFTDRDFQSAMEYFKISYDLCKHSMTISLASIAAFGALLGGVFRDKVLSSPPVLPIVPFILFLFAASMGYLGMDLMRTDIARVSGFKSKDDFNAQATRKVKRLLEWLLGFSYALGLGLFLYIMFGEG